MVYLRTAADWPGRCSGCLHHTEFDYERQLHDSGPLGKIYRNNQSLVVKMGMKRFDRRPDLTKEILSSYQFRYIFFLVNDRGVETLFRE